MVCGGPRAPLIGPSGQLGQLSGLARPQIVPSGLTAHMHLAYSGADHARHFRRLLRRPHRWYCSPVSKPGAFTLRVLPLWGLLPVTGLRCAVYGIDAPSVSDWDRMSAGGTYLLN